MTPLTPTTNDVSTFLQKTISVMVRIQGACNFIKIEGLKISKDKIFYYNGVL